MPRKPAPYTLSAAHVHAHASALAVVCLDSRAIGQSYRLHADRPGIACNASIRADGSPVQWSPLGAPSAAPGIPSLTRVDIIGPIAQRATWVECEGYVDGHDAIAERMIAALEAGDVLLYVDSPGGIAAGGQESIRSIAAAKARHGRTITVWAGETIGSMATWYALALGDSLWTPALGIVGSIGSRGAHLSIAVALEREGIAWTGFSAPGAGKLAFTAETPLSELGRARAERDIWDVYLQFEADVCAAPLGQTLGLTPLVLRALDSDALIGQRAVDARLASGVSTLDAVTELALTRAAMGAPGDTMDDPKKDAAAEGAGMEPDAKCKACGMQNEPDAKFCDQCGASMAAPPMPGDGEDDEEDPASLPPAAQHPQPAPLAKASRAAPRMSADAGLAMVLGAKGDSVPALLAPAIKMRSTLDAVAKLVGARGHLDGDGILEGVALALDDRDAARSRAERYKAKSTEQQARSDSRERMDMLRDLETSGTYTRGELFVDVLDKTGKRVAVAPAPEWSDDKAKGRTLDNLRVHHAAKMAAAKTRPAAKSSPFQPKVVAADGDEGEVKDLAASSGMDPKLLARANNFVNKNLGGNS